MPDKLIDSFTDDRGHGAFPDAIVGSTVSDMGDFATYVVDNKVSRWSPAKIGTMPLPSALDICTTWMEEFLTNITIEQQECIDKYVTSIKEINDVHGEQSTPHMERLDAAEVALQQTMTSDQWEDFRVRAKGILRHGFVSDQAAQFDVHWGRRWICKRAHELGWTSERFGDFDNRIRGHNRSGHRVERIGKKYQWLALQELVARMGDNLAFIDRHREESDDEPTSDRIARVVGLHNIDPSLLTTQTHYDGWGEWGRTWWVPFDPQFRVMVPHERLAWLESDSDIINESALIGLRNPKTGRRWLALSGFSDWRDFGIRCNEKEYQRNTWFRLTCIVVRREHQTKMIESLGGKILTDPDSFPRIELHSGNHYIGEYDWHPETRGFDRWVSQDDWYQVAVPIRPTSASYVCERGGYDYSINQTISVQIPALWLSKCMGLRLSSGRSLIFVNSTGKNTFYDPSVVESGPAAALVEREAFLRMLDGQDLSAIWVIAGEKNAYGGRDVGSGFGGSLRHTAIYRLEGDNFSRILHTDWIRPTASQLKKFFGEEPIPSGIVTRT